MEAPEESLVAPLDSVGWMIVGGLVEGGWDVRLADLKMFRKKFMEMLLCAIRYTKFYVKF